MLGIVSMAGNALKAFGNTHPAVRWGVIVLAFLLAAEFIGKEGISLYKAMATANIDVRVQNSRAVNINLTPDQRERQREVNLYRADPDWGRAKALDAWAKLDGPDKDRAQGECAKRGIETNGDDAIAQCMTVLAAWAIEHAGICKMATGRERQQYECD